MTPTLVQNVFPELENKSWWDPGIDLEGWLDDDFSRRQVLIMNPDFEKGLGGWFAGVGSWDPGALAWVPQIVDSLTIGPSGGSNGATPLTSDAYPDTWQGFTIEGSATLTYSTSSPIHGSVSLVANAGGASQRACGRKGGFDALTHPYARCYFNKSTTPVVNQTFIKAYTTYNSGVQCISVRCNTTPKFEVTQADNAVVATSATSVPIAADFRLMLEVDLATGVGTLNIYTSKDSLDPVESLPFKGVFTATAGEWNFGNAASNNVAGTLKFGCIKVSSFDPGPWGSGETSGTKFTPHSGSRAARFRFPAPSSGYAGCVYGPPQPLKVGKLYRYSQWLYVPTGTPDLVLEVPFVSDSATITTKDAWTNPSLDFVATDEIYDWIGVKNAAASSYALGEYFYLDDATIAEQAVAPDGQGFLSIL